MIGLVNWLFKKTDSNPVLEIEHMKVEVITVAPYVEDGQEFNRVVRDKWKLVLSDETFDLLFEDHPTNPTALLNGKPVSPAFGHLCTEAFFDRDKEKRKELILLLKKHKSKKEEHYLDFNLW